MNMELPFLPYGRHCIEEDDIAAVAAVLRSDSLTGGPEVRRFEIAFATRVGARFAVACANGTAALHLAAMALEMGAGQCVVVPSLTFLATANGPHYTGADIIFADVDSATGHMTPATLEEALGRAGDSVRAVFPVHLNGHVADIEALAAVASRHGLAVIEDAAHSLGATYRTRTGEEVLVGSCRHSAMTVFSLHPVKTIAMGEGGVVTTNDAALYEKLLRLRNHGMVRQPEQFEFTDQAFDNQGVLNPWYYEMPWPGFNYRVSEMQCALALSQLGKLDRFLGLRRTLSQAYDEALTPLLPLVRPAPHLDGVRSGWHLYVVHLDFLTMGKSRAKVMNCLRENGIGTQVHYLPVHRQPYWQAQQSDVHLPGADGYYATCLSLPLFPTMSLADVHRVTATLKHVLEST